MDSNENKATAPVVAPPRWLYSAKGEAFPVTSIREIYLTEKGLAVATDVLSQSKSYSGSGNPVIYYTPKTYYYTKEEGQAICAALGVQFAKLKQREMKKGNSNYGGPGNTYIPPSIPEADQIDSVPF